MSKKVTFWVANLLERQKLIEFLQCQQQPVTVSIEQGLVKKRSNDQNRLQRLWFNELEQQGDMTAEEYRAYCKLHFGVPILRNDDEDFRRAYDAEVKPYSYERKLKFMAEPFNFPVTRLMTVKQHKRYLDAIYVFYTGKGFELTEPDDMMWSNCDELV